MSQRQFSIGDFVTFRDKGVSREGRVVSRELVGDRDRFGRRPGEWFTIRLAGMLFEDVQAPATALGGILQATA